MDKLFIVFMTMFILTGCGGGNSPVSNEQPDLNETPVVITPPTTPPATPNNPDSEVALPNGRIIQNLSIIASHNGVKYIYHVYLPASYNEETSDYPLFIMTDAQFSVSAFAGVIDGDKRELILIGIEDAGRRSIDFTLPEAEFYINFLLTQFVPKLLENYNIDESNIALQGYSFGGLMTGLTLLFDHPDKPTFKHLLSYDGAFGRTPEAIADLIDERRQASNEMNVNIVLTGANLAGNGPHVRNFAQALRDQSFDSLNIIEAYYDVGHDVMAGTSFEPSLDAIYGVNGPTK